jgi:hypothetical protein
MTEAARFESEMEGRMKRTSRAMLKMVVVAEVFGDSASKIIVSNLAFEITAPTIDLSGAPTPTFS